MSGNFLITVQKNIVDDFTYFVVVTIIYLTSKVSMNTKKFSGIFFIVIVIIKSFVGADRNATISVFKHQKDVCHKDKYKVHLRTNKTSNEDDENLPCDGKSPCLRYEIFSMYSIFCIHVFPFFSCRL